MGKRADLVLLADDPLLDVGHLNRPLAVITRGRWYGRELLDAELAALDAKYPDLTKILPVKH